MEVKLKGKMETKAYIKPELVVIVAEVGEEFLQTSAIDIYDDAEDNTIDDKTLVW